MHPFTEYLLREHNYIVNVTLVEQNVLVVNYAGKLKTSYAIYQEHDSLLVGLGCFDHKIEEHVYLNPYTARLYILCDIYSRCRELKLPYNIVKFFDKYEPETESTIMNLLPMRMTEDDIVKEKLLNDIVLDIFKDHKKINSFDLEAREGGIAKSLNVLKGLLV